MKKKIISILLTIVMLIGIIPSGAIGVFAESGSERIAFMYYDESTNALRKGFFNGNYTEIENTTTSWQTGWYVAEGEVTIDTRVTVTGDVKLILKDGCKLTVIGGIRLTGSNKLTVFGQPAGTGELNTLDDGTVAGGRNAGIGGNIHESAGILTVYGGTVSAESDNAAGIGGGAGGGNGGTVTVYGGTVRASSRYDSACIGGGARWVSGEDYGPTKGGTVTVYGGTVSAESDKAAGIGGVGGGAATLTINGGDVTVSSTSSGTTVSVTGGTLNSSGTISGKLTVSGGTFIAKREDKESLAINGTVEVNGGSVTVETEGYKSTCIIGPVTVNGGTLNVTAGDYGTCIDGAVTVNAGTVYATATAGGSGKSIKGNFTLNGGMVNTSVGHHGMCVSDGICTINGGSFYATAGFYSSCIGTDNINVNNNIRLFNFEDGTYFEKKEGQSWKDALVGYSPDKYFTILSFIAIKSSEDNGSVSYLEYDSGTGSFTKQEHKYSECQVVNGNTTTLSDGWYVVYGSKTIPGTVTVTGDVKLILADYSNLTVNGSITVNEGNSLTVYAQSEGNSVGKITVNGEGLNAGIGGSFWNNGGNVTINGGNVSVTAATGVYSWHEYTGAGIGGGGSGKNGGNVTINGGTVSASGYNGIGCGSNGNNNGTLTIAENLFVYNKDTGNPISRIGGQPWADAVSRKNLLITNQEIQAVYNEDDSEIQYLEYVDGSFRSNTYNGEIYDVYSIANNPYSPVYTLIDGWYVVHGNAVITSTLVVDGDAKLVLTDGCKLEALAGIGVNVGSSLTIYAQSDGENMGELYAEGAVVEMGNLLVVGNAGIGGCKYKDGIETNVDTAGDITIHGGKITAIGKDGGAGIGGASGSITKILFSETETITECGNIIIYGGDITAEGSDGAAGIGIAKLCEGGSVGIYPNAKIHAVSEATAGIKAETVTVYPRLAHDVIHVKQNDADIDGSPFTQTTVIGSLLGTGNVDIIPDIIHIYNGTYVDNKNGTHSAKCAVCGELDVAVSHEWGNLNVSMHKCALCNAESAHTDPNCDGVCDDCGIELCKHESATVIYEWSYGNNISCTAKDKCDICGGILSSEAAKEITVYEEVPGKDCQTMGIKYYQASFDSFDSAISEPQNTTYGPHIDSDNNGYCDLCGEFLIETYGIITEDTTTLSDEKYSKWLLNADVEIDGQLVINGNITVHLTDGCTLTVKKGILLTEGNSLTVYAESEGENMGKIIATGEDLCAGIGSGFRQNAGDFTVNSGYIKAIGGYAAPGIGGGFGGKDGTFTKNGGIVEAIDGEGYGSFHEHTYSTEWSVSESHHWHDATCEHTGYVSGFATHTFDENGKCTVCGYEKKTDALTEAKTAAKAEIDKLIKDADDDIKAIGTTAKTEIDTLTSITAVTEKLTEAIAKINSKQTEKAIAAATEKLEELEVISSKARTIKKSVKPLLATASSPAEVNAIMTQTLAGIEEAEAKVTDTDRHLVNKLPVEVGNMMGRQTKIGDESKGRVIIPVTLEQLESIGDKLVIVGGDFEKETTVEIDCAYTYFYDGETKIEAKDITVNENGDKAYAFIIIDCDAEHNPISGYGYYRLYNNSVSTENFLFDVIYADPKGYDN